jgi:ADP-ribose pyrophosphatase YjhB (NUDIX family)
MVAPEPEFSAGGVVVRDERCIVIVPAGRSYRDRRVLALPKGHPNAGESIIDAALREVREETGVEAVMREKLGDVRYYYQREGRRIAKTVSFFLLDYVSGELTDHDHEVEDAEWMPMSQAARELTYKGERDMVSRALSRSRASG